MAPTEHTIARMCTSVATIGCARPDAQLQRRQRRASWRERSRVCGT